MISLTFLPRRAATERGLVSREPHPDDRRQVLIALTDAGRHELTASKRTRDEWVTARLGALTPEERATVAAATPLLERLANS